MRSYVLSNGIVITDSRSLGCGIDIGEQYTHYIFLAYDHDDGFYLNFHSAHLTIDDVDMYLGELLMMRGILQEAIDYVD